MACHIEWKFTPWALRLSEIIYAGNLIYYHLLLYMQTHFISKFNKNESKFWHRTIVKCDYSCSILKFNIATTKNYEPCRKVTQKKNYPDRNSYIIILTSSRVIFTYRNSQRHTFCLLAVIVSGVRLPLRGPELTLSLLGAMDPSLLRWETHYEMMLEER